MEKINFTVKDIKTANFDINDVVVKDVYPPLVNETVIPTKEQQVLTHEGEYGYDKVTVEPIPDEYIIPEGTLPITENTTYDVRRYSRVSANVKPAPELQDKEVIPTKETQNITYDPGFDGLGTVEIKPIPDNYIIPELQTKEVTPIKETQIITPDNNFDGLESVVINSIPDEYIIPTLQNKEAVPTKETQTIEADETFTGLKTVQIKPIPDEYIVPNGKLEITETGIHDVTNYEEVNVNINAAEDLSEELTEYNEELATQEVTIDDIAKALRNKVLSSGGSTLNVFTQEEEPETKEGLWLQTSEQYDSVSLRDNPFETKLTGRPQLSFDIMNNAGVLVGNYVYLFGGDVTSNTRSYVYKYDLTNNSYARLSNMPFITAYKPAIAIGTDIYISGYSSGTNVFYKFNTTTETYTKLANEPISLEFSCLINVGDYIYAIGGTNMKNNMYKYSISNNTWTLMSSKLPELFSQTSGFVIGTDIYLVSTCLSGYASTQHNYVFDTVTETFRTLPSVSPEGFVVVATLVEDNFVYLVGGGGTDNPRMFKYYPDTDMYVKCGYLPGGYGACPICYGNEFLSFGGYGKTRNLFGVTIDKRETPIVNGKTVIVDTIENPKEFNKSITLLDNINSPLLNLNEYHTKYFVDIIYKLNENNIDVPVYYGDGTQWIKIKKPNNLLKLLEENASWVSYAGTEASATFNNNNTITISANGTSGWGIDIVQQNLTLEKGKTYKFSCNNIGSSTWISINNEQTMSLRSSVTSLEFTPTENIENPTIIIWAESSAVYDNVVWDIKLKEV